MGIVSSVEAAARLGVAGRGQDNQPQSENQSRPPSSTPSSPLASRPRSQPNAQSFTASVEVEEVAIEEVPGRKNRFVTRQIRKSTSAVRMNSSYESQNASGFGSVSPRPSHSSASSAVALFCPSPSFRPGSISTSRGVAEAAAEDSTRGANRKAVEQSSSPARARSNGGDGGDGGRA